MRELVLVVGTQAKVLRPDPQSRVPVEARLTPELEPGLRIGGRDEELHLHLLELARTKNEVAGRDLVAEALADLRDPERRLPPRELKDVLEVDEDALRRLRAQVRLLARLLDDADARLEEQVEVLISGAAYGDPEIRENMRRELRERLIEAEQEGRPLRVYCGYDPTSTDLHLGHTITMRKLRQFQDLGHEITFLIGSYTALVGDPSDKNKARPILTQEQVAHNAQTYAEQAFRVLDPQKTKVRYNGEWLSELSLLDLIRLGQNFTVQQFLARENFAKRLEKGEPIFLHETFYALMQGYDAVAMQTDVQVGGTDQLFNIIVAGRKLQEALGQKPLVGIITGILPGTDGVQRMSKSTGNIVPIYSGADDMYGKLMSIPDFAMGKFMRLVTRWHPYQIEAIEKDIESGELHPRDAKMNVAFEITSIFYGEAEANKAQDTFVKTFQQKELPDEMPEFELQTGQTVLDVLEMPRPGLDLSLRFPVAGTDRAETTGREGARGNRARGNRARGNRARGNRSCDRACRDRARRADHVAHAALRSGHRRGRPDPRDRPRGSVRPVGPQRFGQEYARLRHHGASQVRDYGWHDPSEWAEHFGVGSGRTSPCGIVHGLPKTRCNSGRRDARVSAACDHEHPPPRTEGG